MQALFAVGEVEPAQALGEDTWQQCRRVPGPDHATTLLAAATLAQSMAGLTEVEPARALGEDTLARCRRVLGPDHATTLLAAAALAFARVAWGEAEPAAAWARRPRIAAAGRSARTASQRWRRPLA